MEGVTSRIIRANPWRELVPYYWGKSFWSDGYFYRSVGAVNYQTMKHYVERSQDKHWKKQDISVYKAEKQTTMKQWAGASS